MTKSDKRERQKQNRAAAQAAREAAAKRGRRNRSARNLALLLLPVVAILAWSQFRGSEDSSQTSTTSTTATTRTTRPVTSTTIDASKQYTATMRTSKGTIVLALDARNAPIATNHFVQLAKSGYYDGLTFHRVIPDFVIQGGDPKGDGTGEAPSSVVGEVPDGAYPLGAIAAAKTPSAPAGTFGDQFFIVTGPQGESLPPEYATWGVVTEGLDVAQAISNVPRDASDKPDKPVYIVKVSITESAG
ncbi:MAG: peptidylprolyl isomerase [Actinomycetes bacterium]